MIGVNVQNLEVKSTKLKAIKTKQSPKNVRSDIKQTTVPYSLSYILMLMAKKVTTLPTRRLSGVITGALLLIAIVSGLSGLLAMRNNNVTALKLRDQVNQVDKDNGDVETALRTLREYIYSHMNTDLSSGPNAIKPPIQLKYRYDRLLEAQTAALGQQNETIYTAAQAACEKQFPVGLSGSGRIPCIKDYITSHGVQSSATIPDSLYKFDFVSPAWSPDRAGWSFVVAGIAAILFLVRFGLSRWTRSELSY